MQNRSWTDPGKFFCTTITYATPDDNHSTKISTYSEFLNKNLVGDLEDQVAQEENTTEPTEFRSIDASILVDTKYS